MKSIIIVIITVPQFLSMPNFLHMKFSIVFHRIQVISMSNSMKALRFQEIRPEPGRQNPPTARGQAPQPRAQLFPNLPKDIGERMRN